MIETEGLSPRRIRTEILSPKNFGLDLDSSDIGIAKGCGRIRNNIEILNGRMYPLKSQFQMSWEGSVAERGTYTATTVVDGNYWGFYWSASAEIMHYTLKVVNLSTHTTPATIGTFLMFTSMPMTMTPYKNSIVICGYGGTYEVYYVSYVGWRCRELGKKAPQIESIPFHGVGVISMGSYQYGVEFVDKVDEVVVRSSGVNRINVSGDLQDVFEVTEYCTLEVRIKETTTDYTHIRLWRSKNTVANSDGVILGDRATLYCVKELTKAQFEATLDGSSVGTIVDTVSDPYLPVQSLKEILPTTPEVLDLLPFSFVHVIGVVGSGSLFGAGVSGDESGIYPSAGRYGERYAGQYSPADRVGSVSTGEIRDLFGFGEDLVVRTSLGMWRLPGADIDTPLIRIADVPPVAGMCSICSIDGFGVVLLSPISGVGYLTTDYVWKESFPGKGGLINKYLRNSDLSKATLGYAGGRLCISGVRGGEYRGVFMYDQISGWVRLGIPSETDHGVFKTPNGSLAILYYNKYIMLNMGSTNYLTAVVDIGPFKPPTPEGGVVEMVEAWIEGKIVPSEITQAMVSVKDAAGVTHTRELEILPGSTGSFSTGVVKMRLKEVENHPTTIWGDSLTVTLTINPTSPETYVEAVRLLGYVQDGGVSESRISMADMYEDSATTGLLGAYMRFTQPDPEADYFGHGGLE